MNREEAKEIFIEIQRLYPLFNRERDKELARLWIDRLQLGDYAGTKQKLLDYSMESPYPPALADILFRKRKEPENLLKKEIQQAEEAVRKEKEDPTSATKREQLYNELQRKLKEVGSYE